MCTDWGYETSSRKWNRGRNGLHQLGSLLRPLFYFLDDVSYPQSVQVDHGSLTVFFLTLICLLLCLPSERKVKIGQLMGKVVELPNLSQQHLQGGPSG